MNKASLLVVPFVVALSACSMEDPQTGEKTELGKAAEHTKEAAKSVGNAITEMNKDRIESPPNEDTSMPVEQPKGDTEAIKDSLRSARDTVVDASKAAVDKVKSLNADSKE